MIRRPTPLETGFVIRPYEPRDRDGVTALWQAAFPQTGAAAASDIEVCVRTGHGALFVGSLDGTMVAALIAGFDGNRGWLHRVATRESYRGRGYATRLVAHAEAYLAELGAPKVNLQLLASNAGVQAFYEKRGYVVEPRIAMGKRFTKKPPLALPSGDEVPPGRLRVVITHMEMQARPRLPTPPLPAFKIAVLRADQISVPFYRYLYNTVGAPWLWYERRRLSDEALAATIQHEHVDVYVLYAAGEPAGYVELDRREWPDVELAYFGLVPHFIGRGLGPWFLHWAVDTAWAGSPRRVWVHTCNLDHPKAMALYQRMGFVPFKQETKRIVDPRPLR
jgi:GNAT superfamily N-acetyltransferase